MTDADLALARLRSDDEPALGNLVRLVADHAATVRLDAIAEPAQLARLVLDALRAVAEGADRDALIQRIDAERAALADRTEPVRTWMHPAAEPAVRQLIATEWSPSQDLVVKVLSNPAMRSMLKDVLAGAFSNFAQRLRSLDKGVLGGLGGKVARRGKGLFGGVAGNLGAAAEGLVGAVRDEMEGAIEGRIKDSVGQAAEDTIRSIAAWVSDPAHAPALAQMRLSLLDLVLDTPLSELVAEADEVETDAIVDVLLRAVRDAAEAPELAAELERLCQQAIEPWGDRQLAGWLKDLGLEEAWRELVHDALTPELRRVVATDAFGGWWSELFRA